MLYAAARRTSACYVVQCDGMHRDNRLCRLAIGHHAARLLRSAIQLLNYCKNCDNDRLHCTLILVVTPPRLHPQARPPNPTTRNTRTTGLSRLFPYQNGDRDFGNVGEILQMLFS